MRKRQQMQLPSCSALANVLNQNPLTCNSILLFHQVGCVYLCQCLLIAECYEAC